VNNQLTVPTDDGWNDAATEAGERIIRGTILRFADWRWTAGKEGTPIDTAATLVAMATAAMWVRWEDGRPAEYIVRQPGHKLPEREELGFDNPDQWEPGVDGNPVDPWRNTRLVYLVDPRTAAAFTFSTSSFRGRRAVSDLGDQIARMRLVHPDAVPEVELGAVEMSTKYGRKSRPVFKIVAWKTTSAESLPAERQITAQVAEQQVSRHEMDDEIPF
jgi:hypothetical protein